MSRSSKLFTVLFLWVVLPSSIPLLAGELAYLETTKLLATDGAPGDSLGGSVAVGGDLIVVGARWDDGGKGAAYVFARNQGGADGWGEVAKLTASDGAGGDGFGISVAISGDRIVVGAMNADVGGNSDQGAAYIFDRNHGGLDAWGEVTKITPADGAEYDFFAETVSIDGDTFAAGSSGADIGGNTNQGAVYVFGRNQGGADNWGQVAKVTSSDAIADTAYGRKLSISGDTLAVGNAHANYNLGRVYVYSRNEGGEDNWGEVRILTASDGNVMDRFGWSIGVDGVRIVVGAYSDTVGSNPSQGSAYLFERNHGGYDNWGEVAHLTAPAGLAGDWLGFSVGISGDVVVAGAAYADIDGASQQGAAWVFKRNYGGTDSWGALGRLVASDGAADDWYGWSVAVDGFNVVAGVPSSDPGGSSGQGAAYLYTACGATAAEWTETAKTVASDGFSGHQYAHDVAFNGEIAVVGAKYDGDLGSAAGAAYILMRNQGSLDNWGELKKIYANDGSPNHFFGERLDMSGDLIVVGVDEDDSHGDNSGAFYLFGRNEDGVDNWGQINKFTASDATAGAWFGYDIAIDNDTVVVGAIYDSNGVGTNAGAAYIFKKNEGMGTNWGEVAKLASDDLWQWDMFGYSVGISGDTVAVGAWRESDGSAIESGAVYIFERNQGGADNWGQVAKLKASDAASVDYFGSGLAIDNDTVVVGSPGDDNVGFSSGSAYVFERNHGGADNWGEVAKLTASDASDGDLFGYAQTLAINGDVIVIGSYKNEHAGIASGTVYVFERNAGGVDAWDETLKLVPGDQSYAQNFGNAVDLRSGRVMIGAVNDSSMGAVYFFDAGCPEFDFGDAIDPDYPTLLVSNGARHKLGGSVYLGAAVDMDLDGQPTVGTDGDDLDADGDDEDGVTFTSPVVTGGSADVDVVASDTGLLNAWIDFNDDGDWDDTGEQVFTDEALVAGTNSLIFAVPLDTNPGENATARFRVSTAGGLSYDGEAGDGEVEDHEVFIEELDYGDAPDPAYPTLLASDGARHILGGPLYLGAHVDPEIDGLPSADALGDDQNNLDDEDGVVFGSLIVIGTMAEVDVTASAAGLLNAWVDFNADGDWLDAGEQIFTDEPLVVASNLLGFTVPPTTVAGTLFARFRVDTSGGLSPTGLALDGEVEDYSLTAVELDYGDAPDPFYPTLTASSGARHILGSGLYLGASVDAELDGQPSANADGDDLDGNDDEDGVVFTTGIGAGLDASLEVTASGVGLLNAWVDFNADGDWSDAGEQVFTDQALVAGVNALSFAVPSGATLGTTFARFRVDTIGSLSFDGTAADGEVEDHQLEIVEGPDLQVEMVASSNPTPSGHPLTYTITVTNNGPLDATSVTLTDTLPGELVFVSSTPSSPDCTFSVDTLTCDLGTMSPSDTTQVVIETVLDHPVWGSFSNASSVSASETDPIPANNTATVDTIIAIFVDGWESGDLSAWD
jgi:uncharacterized repeat protein (TIGR01451 family)